MGRASRVIAYIESLVTFKLEKYAEREQHMGVTITDAILQAGIDFESVVRPRLHDVRQHSQARTTSGFLALLKSQGVNSILRWKGERKPRTVLDVAELLAADSVETELDLKAWLEVPDNVARLLKIKGVGPKTLDYLQILAGVPTVAIDRHLERFLKDAGVTVGSYEEARDVLLQVARRMGVNPAQLDYTIWKYKSDEKPGLTGRCRQRQKSGHA